MHDQSSTSDPANGQVRFRQLRLSTLLMLVLAAGLMAGWWIDHTELKKQIPSEATKIVKIYSLKNASLDQVVEKLNDIYSDRVATPFKGNQSIIVRAEIKQHDQIELILRHLDRPETEFIPQKLEAKQDSNEKKWDLESNTSEKESG